jgi:hypothetical protein
MHNAIFMRYGSTFKGKVPVYSPECSLATGFFDGSAYTAEHYIPGKGYLQRVFIIKPQYKVGEFWVLDR